MESCLNDAALAQMLADDVPYGDLTTDGLGIGSLPGRMIMCAREASCLCGSEEAARLIELSGGVVVESRPSSSRLAAGEVLLVAEGSAASLHRVWKTAQTLVEHLSGIASAAADILDALRHAGFDLPLACTRKNFPGTRALSVKAIRAGGAVAHRLGLSETLLVFPDHRVFVDKSEWPVRLAQLRRQAPEKKLVVEVADRDDAIAVAELGADVLQLERFSPEALAACKDALRARGLGALVAPAGGVTLANAVAYARAGADFLISSAPYFAVPRDVQVRFSGR
ncbi:MAG: ModD protein [Pseudomonadota bacterium]|jgi:molybdenum transport protein